MIYRAEGGRMVNRIYSFLNKVNNTPEDILRNNATQAKSDGSSVPFEQLLIASLNKVNTNQMNIMNRIIDPALTPQMPAETGKTNASNKFDEIMKVVFKHEGSRYVSKDGGRESSKFGILQSTARQYGYTGDIKNITQDEAKEIYRKLWDKSGADKLPYELSLVHFDSYINSPASAVKFLEQSGGNVDKYLKLREARYQRLAELRPERFSRYLKGWMNRIASLRGAVTEHTMTASLQGVNSNMASLKTTIDNT
jgi:hypothetical protein